MALGAGVGVRAGTGTDTERGATTVARGGGRRLRRGRVPLSHAPGEPRRIAYLYLLPAFLVYAAFLLYPLVRAVQISFYDWDGLTLASWVGFQNYADVLADEGLRAAFGHALVLIGFFAVLPTVVGLVLASILNRARVRGLPFFRTVVFLPQVIAMVVVAVAWRRIFAPDGGLNSLLDAVGLGSLGRAWLGDYGTALPAIGFVGTWFETGLVTILLLAGMGRINPELYEAARLDGAGPVREFLAVTLPSVRGEISVALTLTVIAALRTFDLVYVTTRGGPGNTTSVPSYEVYNRAFQLGQVGSAAAIGVCLTVLIFAISFVITRIGDRGDS
ncbi:raffinose/stachyose/melibiose transport system permease protein [Terracoccus luteus]|uniref:Raffinose/stachyose/melibiose transport system permease protein n=1 Tax=Terracoccus luteus TaxID=53356 RepID=A0A839PWD6_9MICO|nr:raffinose/stachyose/melibiose transport system permease protein [Terracoccus luteus]MCP2172104.1 raffinose/stachyose/melibiose transport system permease protein [Terracoccus luteus]